MGAVRIAHVADPNALPPLDEVEEEEWEEHNDEARMRRWNIYGSFVNFLAREAQRESPRLAPAPEPSPPSTPAKSDYEPETPVATVRIKRRPPTPHVKKVARLGSLPSSSPPSSSEKGPLLSPEASAGPSRPSIFPHRSTYPSLELLASRSSSSTPSSPFPHPTPVPVTLDLPTVTPFPSHPIHRRRLSRAMQRFEHLNKKGLNLLSEDDTEEEEDQLQDDDVVEGLAVEKEEVVKHKITQMQQHPWPVPKFNPFAGKAGKGKTTKFVKKQPQRENSPDIFEALERLAREKQQREFDGDEFFDEDEHDIVDSDGLLEGWEKNWNPYEEEEI